MVAPNAPKGGRESSRTALAEYQSSISPVGRDGAQRPLEDHGPPGILRRMGGQFEEFRILRAGGAPARGAQPELDEAYGRQHLLRGIRGEGGEFDPAGS